MTALSGFVEPGWEPLRAAFLHNLEHTEEVGAGCSVYHRGREVVRLSGGRFHDTPDAAPYDDRALQLVFSTTKGVTAIGVAWCVERGLLAYDRPVVDYWPEFAAAGKHAITVAELLSHQAGLFTIDAQPTLEQALDWAWMTEQLAAQAPLWAPGSRHGYHAVTYGLLAGELVRRVDPLRRSFGRFVAEELTEPLGAEFWIGLPEEHETRVSPLIPTPIPTDPVMVALMQQFLGPETNAGRALTINGAFGQLGAPDTGLFNGRTIHAAEIPAAGGIGNASGLARLYAATIGEVDGVRLLGPETVERARTTVTTPGAGDAVIIAPTTFGMGFMTHGPSTPYAGPGSYGHTGLGGSVAFAQPERELAFAYVMNRLAQNLAGDQRAQRLIDAAARCADAHA